MWSIIVFIHGTSGHHAQKTADISCEAGKENLRRGFRSKDTMKTVLAFVRTSLIFSQTDPRLKAVIACDDFSKASSEEDRKESRFLSNTPGAGCVIRDVYGNMCAGFFGLPAGALLIANKSFALSSISTDSEAAIDSRGKIYTNTLISSSARGYLHPLEEPEWLEWKESLKEGNPFCPGNREKPVWKSSCNIISPRKSSRIVRAFCTGTVACVSEQSVTVYLASHDSHKIWAPVSGTIIDLTGYEGNFFRRELLWFEANPLKKARAIITLQTSEGDCLEFWLEVGKDWLVHGFLFSSKVRIGQQVKAGDLLGELAIGSVGELHVPHHAHLLVKSGDKVEGGKTPLLLF